LDSWKAIADYLRRDTSTVRRWERTAGLPVRRVNAGRRQSVFAYRDEVDAWLKGMGPDAPSASLDVPDSPDPPDAPEQAIPDVRPPIVEQVVQRTSMRWLAGSACVVAVLLSIAWQARASRAGEAVRLRVTPEEIIGLGRDGAERWRYRYPSGQPVSLMSEWSRPAAAAVPGNPRTFVTGIGARTSAEGGPESGQLLGFTTDGILQRTFTFEDRVSFGGREYTGPWAMTDFQVDPHAGALRIAVAAHHYQWWPSLVTVLDETWHRRATFANAGWIERIHWASRDRLIVTGFSNARDGGMVALLDANALDGQSPAAGGTPFDCTSCGGNPPLRYFVLPRSEVNRVTGSPFNRALLEVMRDRLIVRTVEVPSIGAEAADGLYEFSPSLELIRASYSDRYWELHAALEKAGKIDHPRARCPGRDGPPAIEIWDPSHGWTVHQIRARRVRGFALDYTRPRSPLRRLAPVA
jgi:hypothetical protein